MPTPKEIKPDKIFGQTIRVYQNLRTSNPLNIFDDMDINQRALEERGAKEVAAENFKQEEQYRTGRVIRTG